MKEIANCPLCGESPQILDYYGVEYEKSYSCCGVEIYELLLWNKYAAAMELAKAEIEQEKAIQLAANGYVRTNYFSKKEFARKRVFEAFR